MTDVPANPNVQPKRYSPFWFRFFEILPGAAVWLALLLPFALSFTFPLAVTVFILIFDVYWLILSLAHAVILVSGYYHLRRNMRTDWKQYLKTIEEIPAEELAAAGIIDWREIYHVVLLTTYREEQDILEASLDSIVEADYPSDKIIFVLATEERDAERARRIGAALKEKYSHHFFKFLVTEHPDGVVGEVKAKGANATWAAKQLVKELEGTGIRFDRVIVSTADADSRFDKSYFNCLTYYFATSPDRTRCSFQPIPMYFNNIWQAPMISRVLAFSTTFWQLIESIRDYRLITFATHAMSLQTLVDIDYWCTSIVNEDSRQFFRAFFHYNGDFRVVPLFIPIYMDAVHVQSYYGTFKNLYLQQQRWAYGVEHFPYIVMESTKRPKIPLMDRIMLIWRAFLGSFSWATSSFFITMVGWIPILLNESFRNQVVVANFILATKTILSVTWIGIFISAAITIAILPGKPGDRFGIRFLTATIQWALVPITTILFGGLPGLDAQTRLMLGKYLGFRVTEKAAPKAKVA